MLGHRGEHTPIPVQLTFFRIMQSPASRYEDARRVFSESKDHWLAGEPLERWSRPSDLHLPSSLIVLPLRDLLEKPYHVLLQTKGVGEAKLEKLVVLVERALKDFVCNDESMVFENGNCAHLVAKPTATCTPTTAFPNEADISPSRLTPAVWQETCLYLKRHSLEGYPLGRFAETLDDIPRSLWSVPLSEFVNNSLNELSKLKGYGERRITKVLDVLLNTAKLISGFPAQTHLGIMVFPARIGRVSSWINRMLHEDRLTDYATLCKHFVLPILRQLECDLGSPQAAMIERRLGVGVEAGTLQDIAENFGLTRERIRQVSLRAQEVMEIRWPQGKHLLGDLLEKFRSSGELVRQAGLIQRTLDLLFDVKTGDEVSRESVIAAWEQAGRHKETPMSKNEILVWLAGRFPGLLPSVGAKWIMSEASSIEYEGRRLYFSNDENDQLLHGLYQSGRAATVTDLVDADERGQRNLRMKLQRDLRFTEDEDHYFLPTEFYGFTRDSIGWHINLEPLENGTYPSRPFVSVDSIVAAALSGLLQAGIVDVTVWGFHRFVREQIALLYDARLPDSIDAFVLGDMVVRQSGKRIRPMRRRRLRWDVEGDTAMAARGKRGWVGHVVQRFGQPIVIDELGALLNQSYQDYDSCVIEQLNLDDKEEGEPEYGVSMQPGIPHKLPSILVPDGWKLDTTAENVSDGIKLAVARAITFLQEGRISLSDLDHIPWFVELIRRNSYGTDFQEHTSRVAQAETQRNEQLQLSLNHSGFSPKKSERAAQDDNTSTTQSSNGKRITSVPEKNVDELLQRFL